MLSTLGKIRRLHDLSDKLRYGPATYDEAREYETLMKELRPMDITGILLDEIDRLSWLIQEQARR